jgi:putative nucleotidyltransferase with HDIG domain
MYRTRQFIGALNPRIRADEREDAARLLGRQLMPLFESMTQRDQRHCLDTYIRLRDKGVTDETLLMAALLHDSGKGRLSGVHIKLWHRVGFVVLEDIAPGTLQRMARRRGAMSVLYNHAERGASLAEALGAPPEVVSLIRRHRDDDADDPTLLTLQEADGDL